MNPAPLVEARELSHRQRDRLILDRISLGLDAGEIVSLIGPNGAGKTTLLRLLLGLKPVQQGRVHRRPGLRIGYMPQRFHIEPSLPLCVQRFMTLTRATPAAVGRALARTGAEGLAGQPLQGLSGGELQRVLLARALLRDPELLVLDEPAQGVDIRGQAAFYRLIGQLRDQLGCGVLLVSHDLHLVMENSDRVICLNQHVCCEGNPEAVSGNPAYRQLFGAPDLKGLGIYTHHHDHEHNLHGDAVPHEHGPGCRQP